MLRAVSRMSLSSSASVSRMSAPSPKQDLNHCRSLSMRVIRAVGTSQTLATRLVIRSKSFSGGVSRTWYRRRAASRLPALWTPHQLLHF